MGWHPACYLLVRHVCVWESDRDCVCNGSYFNICYVNPILEKHVYKIKSVSSNKISIITIFFHFFYLVYPLFFTLRDTHAPMHAHTHTLIHTQLSFICQDPAADGDTVWTLTHGFLTFFTGVSYSPTQTSARLRPSLPSCQQVAVTEGVRAGLSHIYRLLLSSLGTETLYFTARHWFGSRLYTKPLCWSCVSIFCCLWWALSWQVCCLM